MRLQYFVMATKFLLVACNGGKKETTVSSSETSQPVTEQTVTGGGNAAAPAQNRTDSGPGSSLSADQSSLTGDQSDLNFEINLAADVLFDFDKSDLKPSADPELQKAADIIKAKGKGLIAITGFTDAKGTDSYNKPLSLRRAEAVRNWFQSHGLQQNFSVEGKGAADPVAPNTNADGSDNPEGRAKNRRVQIIINKTKTVGE